VALMSKDYHSLWLNSAALERADAPLEVHGGVVEESGILRENAAWAFRDRYVRPTVDEMVEASREGMRVAASRGVVAIHDKDGWLGAFEVFERLLEAGELDVRVWQSFPWDRLDDLRGLGLRSGFGNDMLCMGYLKGFMDGTLGSATARLLDGSGVEISSREVLEDVVRRGAEAGWPVAVHAIGDGANRAALDAFEATRDAWQPRGLRQRIEHAQLLDDADVARFAELGVSASCSSATRRPTATSPNASGRAARARTRTARCSMPAPCSRTAPTRRWRSSTRSRASCPACCARSTSARPGAPSRP
jgi:hypothetical protein